MPRSSGRARRPDLLTRPSDLHDYLTPRPRRVGRPVKYDLAGWRVVDDWPARVPVSLEEVAVFEVWFGDILDDLVASEPGESQGRGPRQGACDDLEQK